MFEINTVIDTVQSSKKAMVSSLVQHEGLKRAMVNFIDTQTEVTKTAVKSFQEVNAVLVAEAWNAVREFDVARMIRPAAKKN